MFSKLADPKEKQKFSKGKKEKLITDRLNFEQEDAQAAQILLGQAGVSKKDKITKKTKSKDYKTSQAKSRQGRSGLLFPINRIQNMLKLKVPANARVGATAAVYVSAVLEYLVAELCELSGNRARVGFKSTLDEYGNKKANVDFAKRGARITPQFLNFAIREDREFNELLNRVTVAGGGVLPKSDKQLHSIFPTSKNTKPPKNPLFEDDDDVNIEALNKAKGGASSSSMSNAMNSMNSVINGASSSSMNGANDLFKSVDQFESFGPASSPMPMDGLSANSMGGLSANALAAKKYDILGDDDDDDSLMAKMGSFGATSSAMNNRVDKMTRDNMGMFD